jgi:hypothetical protein
MKVARPNAGFVLLMVLVVLVVAGTVLAAAARRCAQNATRAAVAHRDLQLRWGTLSCRVTVMPKIEQILDDSRTRQEPVVLEARRTVVLGGLPFHLVVGDEMAKANANTIADFLGDEALRQAMRKLQAGGRGFLEIRLRPTDLSREVPDTSVRFASLDQIFVMPHPSEWIGLASADGSIARRRVTCWGDGRINLLRAELPTLREVLKGDLTESQLARLDAMRREESPPPLSQLLAQLQLTGEQTQMVGALVADQSACHSLWVCVEGPTRRWYRLYVREDRGPDDATEWAFAW